jgi:hypothetical protein
MQRLGYSKFTRTVRLLGREGDSLRGWWIARHTDLEDLYWSKGSPQNRMVMMFAFGGGFCMWVGATRPVQPDRSAGARHRSISSGL